MLRKLLCVRLSTIKGSPGFYEKYRILFGCTVRLIEGTTYLHAANRAHGVDRQCPIESSSDSTITSMWCHRINFASWDFQTAALEDGSDGGGSEYDVSFLYCRARYTGNLVFLFPLVL